MASSAPSASVLGASSVTTFDRSSALGGGLGLAFGLAALLVAPFAPLSLRWGLPLAFLGVLFSSWSLARQSSRSERKVKTALGGYLLSSVAFITAVVVSGLALNSDAEANVGSQNGIAASGETVDVSEASFADESWKLETVNLSINEVGLLSGVVQVTNTSQEYRSGSFVLEVETSDRGTLDMIGTTTDLAPGASAEVEVLASGAGVNPRLLGFSVFAQY